MLLAKHGIADLLRERFVDMLSMRDFVAIEAQRFNIEHAILIIVFRQISNDFLEGK